MSHEPEALTINDVEYVRKDAVQSRLAVNTEGLEYVICRGTKAGVHVGFLVSHEGPNVELAASRRVWSWSGAASLSQMAMEGVKKPDDCRFAVTLPKLLLTEVCEIIPCSEAARANIQGVPEWKK